MAKLIKPPTDFSKVQNVVGSIFLSGSIEQGKAVDWQTQIWNGIKDIPALGVLNPRRDEWDSSWEQKIENKKFREQVEWELSALESVDMVVMYFDSKTQSPITLLELGLLSHKFNTFRPKVVVCCQDKFWRKGNVDIICKRYGHKLVDSLEELIQEIHNEFDYLNKLDKDFDNKNCTIGWNKAK